jgi:hypothetical protein
VSQKKLEPEDWDFRSIRAGEERSAAIWEYARESQTLREGSSLENLPPTREVKWLRKLRFIFGNAYLKKPWIAASNEWRMDLPNRIKREREQFLNAVGSEGREKMAEMLEKARPMSVDDPIQVSDELAAATVLYGFLDLDRRSGRELIEIDLTANKKDVLAEVAKIFDARQRTLGIESRGRGKDKPNDWLARLKWLGTLRRRGVHTTRVIAQMRIEDGERGSLETIEREVRREVKKARETFKELFPFIPSEELAR